MIGKTICVHFCSNDAMLSQPITLLRADEVRKTLRTLRNILILSFKKMVLRS